MSQISCYGNLLEAEDTSEMKQRRVDRSLFLCQSVKTRLDVGMREEMPNEISNVSMEKEKFQTCLLN